MPTWGGVPKCPVCERSVYPNEQILAADRKAFHKACFQCQSQHCRADLTARSFRKYEGFVICEKCHEEIYRNKNSRGEEGEESLDMKKKREEEERLKKEKYERMKRERRCPECEQKTFENDSEMLSEGLYYHRACIHCSICRRQPDAETPMLMAPQDNDNIFAPEILEPYCRFCYAKKFKCSAFKVAEAVEIAPDSGYSL